MRKVIITTIHKFAEAGACEVHLATGFQNIIYDHPRFPADLRERVYAHIKEAHANQWKEGQTEEQFIYKNRKRGLGTFKREFWELPQDVRAEIGVALEEQFSFLFEQLGVPASAAMVAAHVQAPEIHKTPADFGLAGELEIGEDLAD